MQIRTKLTLQFLLIGGLILVIASLSVYFFSAKYRQDAFYDRLKSKAGVTANLLLESNAIGAYRLQQLELNNPVKLNSEKIIILNLLDDTLFTTDVNHEIQIRYNILETVRSGRELLYKQGSYEILGSLYYAQGNERFVVLAAAIDTEGHRHLEKLGMILIIVCLLSFVLFAIAGWFYAGRSLKPISAVINKVEDITITSLNLRVNEGNGNDEIGRLAKTFNRMLERLEKSFTMQKDFIANASHELRTPLTSINGQLDVLLMKERTSEEYKNVVVSVLDDTRSLIDLANRLLLIARTSAEGPVNFNRELRIDEVLWQARDEILKFNKEYHITISIDDSLNDASQMLVTGDDSLLKVCISNIMDNACKYSEDHSVDILLKQSEKWIELVFEDHGIGIPEADIKKVFEPFYRSPNVIAYNGSGIGLPLVKQIINNHNGKLELTSKEGVGTRVVMSFPVLNG